MIPSRKRSLTESQSDLLIPRHSSKKASIPTTQDKTIQITVRTINQAKYTITIPTSLSIKELRPIISLQCALDPGIAAENMAVIFKGRLLEHNQTVGHIGIINGDFIVVMETPGTQECHIGMKYYTEKKYKMSFHKWSQGAAKGIYS